VSKWQYLQLKKWRKVTRNQVRRIRWVGDDSHVLVKNVFLKKKVSDGSLS
jgi:hypothetical protein